MNTTKRTKNAQKSLYQRGYKYLYDNFHKFNDAQKIKIALEVYKAEKSKPLVDQSQHFTVEVKISNEDTPAQEPGRGISRYVEV